MDKDSKGQKLKIVLMDFTIYSNLIVFLALDI